jgi:putative spermidine/putrescine transport system ATP-binding protein
MGVAPTAAPVAAPAAEMAERPVHLSLQGLEKRYGALPPSVASLSLQLRQGELLGLLGPSGCGKTTTLRMICGLVEATAGRILVGGRDVTSLPPYRRDMGVVFQAYALFPHMNVAENVAFGLEMRKVAKAEAKDRVLRALAMVRLEGLAARRPRELSGGQQQRVALARALVVEPSILLLDEPLSNLDAKLRDEMRNEIRDIQKRLGITAVFVTHDQVEAMAICDRIGVMNAGRLEQVDSPTAVYEHPATPFVADFVGRMNHLRGRWLADGRVEVCGRPMRAERPCGAAGAALVMVRPHRVMLADACADTTHLNALDGTVQRTTFVGDLVAHEVALGGDETMTVERSTANGVATLPAGTRVRLCWRAEDTLTFPAEQA